MRQKSAVRPPTHGLLLHTDKDDARWWHALLRDHNRLANIVKALALALALA